MNPFTPAYLPYYATPYEMNPYNIFGVYCREHGYTNSNEWFPCVVSRQCQRLSGNLLIEVDETNLVPGQDLTVIPKSFEDRVVLLDRESLNKKFPNVSMRICRCLIKLEFLQMNLLVFLVYLGQTGTGCR